MSAKRVPPGWTQEAADFVWEDWQTRKPGLVNGWAYDALAAIPGMRLAVTSNAGAGDWYVTAWASPEARLRAWAAVGAPVLAPAEDGRPSLAEWVAALPPSATWEGAYRKGEWSFPPSPDGCAIAFVWGRVASIQIHSDDATGAITAMVHANYKQTWHATPDALRDALDRLASEGLP